MTDNFTAPQQRSSTESHDGKSDSLHAGPSSGGAATFDLDPSLTHGAEPASATTDTAPNSDRLTHPTSEDGSVPSHPSTFQTSRASAPDRTAVPDPMSQDEAQVEKSTGQNGMEQMIEYDAQELHSTGPFKVANLSDINEHRGALLEEDLTAEYGDYIPRSTDSSPSAPEHPHLVLQASVSGITPTHVLVSPMSTYANDRVLSQLGNRKKGLWSIDQVSIPYDYLVYALGSKMPDPLRSEARTKADGMHWMKRMQNRIRSSKNIVIVGGGALGVQYATDIATVHPEKASSITLLHSRQQLLPNFDPVVHDKVYAYLKHLGVNVILGERLALAGGCPQGSTVRKGVQTSSIDATFPPTEQPLDETKLIRTTAGRELEADLLLLCTGQQPNSGLMATLSPSSVDPSSRLVKVSRTLQVCVSDPKGAAYGPFEFTPPCGDCDCFVDRKTGDDHSHLAPRTNKDPMEEQQVLANVYAIGDVADAFGAINAGYQAWAMAEVSARNIVRQIRVQEDTDAQSVAQAEAEALEHFTPQPAMLKLSLGLGSMVFQGLPGDNGEPSVEVRDDPEDLAVKSVWRFMAKASTDNMHR